MSDSSMARLGQFACGVLCILSLVAVVPTRAYPNYYAGFAETCTSHPTQGYGWHHPPKFDAGINVKLTQGNRTTDRYCLGASYVVKLFFPNPRYALVTSSHGSLYGGPTPGDTQCPNRRVITGLSTGPKVAYAFPLILGCSQTGNLTIKVTSSQNALDTYWQRTFVFPPGLTADKTIPATQCRSIGKCGPAPIGK